MISEDEKILSVNRIIEEWLEKYDEALILAGLHQLLLAEGTEGKLYKYRKFDEFALKNLENQVLHASRPSVFNDPFDCRMGVGAIYEDEQKILQEVLSKSFSTYFGKAEATNISLDEQGLSNLMENKKSFPGELNELMANDFEGELTQEKLKKILMVSIEPCLWVIEKEEKENLREAFNEFLQPEIMLKNISQFIEEGNIYKHLARNLDVDDDADDITLMTRIAQKVGHPPVEDVGEIGETLKKAINNVAESFDKEFGIICLSSDYKNCLMWSHYAESHRGFCIEYDFSKGIENDQLIFPVIYSNKRPSIPWKLVKESERGEKNNIMEGQKLYSFMKMLVTKSEEWKYEKEWRIIIPTSTDSRSIDVRIPKISCIYLGALCSEQNKKKVIQIARKLGVPVQQMVLDLSEYKLHACLIDVSDGEI